MTGPAKYGADDVPPWMLSEAQPVTDCGSLTQGSAMSIDGAGIRLAKVLAEAGGVLGWKSPEGAMAARTGLTRADGQLGQVRDLVEREAAVWSTFAAAVREHQPPLLRLVRERYDLIGPFNPPESAAPEQIKQIIQKMKVHTGALALADRTALAALRPIVDGYRALTALDREDEWVGSAAPAEVGVLLAQHGITESDAERALLDKLMLLPAGPEGDKELRALLATMTPAEVADFLLRHPDVARRLGTPLGSADSYPPGSPEAVLAAALASSQDPAKRAAAVRAAFAGMPAADQQRLALLYPGTVGNLDGAPLPLRMAANRVKIGVALDDERQRYVDTSRAVDGQDLQWSDDYRSLEPYVGVDDEKTDAERNSRRIDYYQQLLYEEPENPNYRAGTGRPGTAPHQILYFDNAGDGKIAEMWGTYDANTRNVGIWVPGATGDMESFADTSERAYNLAYDSPGGDTVMIAWMGTDLPDSAADGAQGLGAHSYQGGHDLKNFVVGLDIPPEKRVTAIGHSHGGSIVGTADALGMPVDAVVHVGSSGAGYLVTGPEAYKNEDVERYSMTAPGDSIDWVQNAPVPIFGADPDDMGFHQLETGRYPDDYPDPAKAGTRIQDSEDRHVDIAEARHSDAYNNILGVITGGEVTLTNGQTIDTDVD